MIHKNDPDWLRSMAGKTCYVFFCERHFFGLIEDVHAGKCEINERGSWRIVERYLSSPSSDSQYQDTGGWHGAQPGMVFFDNEEEFHEYVVSKLEEDIARLKQVLDWNRKIKNGFRRRQRLARTRRNKQKRTIWTMLGQKIASWARIASYIATAGPR